MMVKSIVAAVAAFASLAAFAERDTAIYRGKLTSDLDANGNAITNVAPPSAPGDAVNKAYVDAISGLTPQDATNAAVAVVAPVAKAATNYTDAAVASATNAIQLCDGAARPLPRYLHALSYDATYPEDVAALRGLLGGRFGCSARRSGNTFERNYDLHLDETAEFVVRMSAVGSRFASLGVANVGTNLTEQFVTSGKPSRWYKVLPSIMLDGINENGVVCEVNVTDGEWGRTSGELHCLEAVRWALDNGTSAGMVASNLAAKVYIPQGFGNFHWMVADEDETWIVENREAIKVTDAVAVMTNYNIGSAGGEGHERYSSLVGGAAITSQWWTAAYDRTTRPIRVSDIGANYEAVWTAWESATKEEHRAQGGWWQTLHTSIYDITNRVLRVAVQETDDWYTFALPSGGVKPGTVKEIVEPMIRDATNAIPRVEIDATLTQYGKAADAYAVGVRIDYLTAADVGALAKDDVIAPSRLTTDAGKAADAKATGDALAEKIPYDGTQGMTIGSRATSVKGNYSVANGGTLTASGNYSHAEGYKTYATGEYSHSEGTMSRSVGRYAHAEGIGTYANGNGSHAEGSGATADGASTHAEGVSTRAKQYGSHAEGCWTDSTFGDDNPDLESYGYSHVGGWAAASTNAVAFVWQGRTLAQLMDHEEPQYGERYYSHGDGTFNLNPVGGLAGFWIGETNIATHLASKADRATTLAGYGITDAYTKTQTDSAINNHHDSTKLDKSGGTMTGELHIDGVSGNHRVLRIGEFYSSPGALYLTPYGFAYGRTSSTSETDVNMTWEEIATINGLAPTYDDDTISPTFYTVGAIVSHNGTIYQCIAPTSGAWNPTKWAARNLRTLFNAEIDAENPRFSNAVLSVGLNISTNDVAAIGQMVDIIHDFPIDPTTGATSIGALLAAIAAAVALLRKRTQLLKSDGTAEDDFAANLLGKQVAISAMRYGLASTSATVKAADRTVTKVMLGTTAVTVTFPDADTAGKTRDFLLRIDAANLATGGSLTITKPTGATIYGDAFPSPEAAKQYLVAITETAANEFYVRTIEITIPTEG